MTTPDRRAVRLALALALATALAYGLGFPLPFIAPLFVVFLAAVPGPPMGPKQLLVLLLVVFLSLGVGVALIPLLNNYPASAVMIVAVGLYFSMYLTVIRGKRMLGMFLTVGFTLISVAGRVDYLLASTVISAIVFGILIAVVSLWMAYPLLPDLPGAAMPAEPPAGEKMSNWIALRAAIIVMPAYLLALTNPAQYMMTIMKSVSLGQQASMVNARHAGRELIGSTFAGGVMAVLFWKLLQIAPTLWMFALWMSAFGLYVGAKLYGQLATRVAPSFWVNAIVTMLILLGPAVEDSANGKDAMTAFVVRFATFIAVTLYAWGALATLERWRNRRFVARSSSNASTAA